MVVATEERAGALNVVLASEFEASCDCHDYEWHREAEQAEGDFGTRKERLSQIEVKDVSAQYGTVVVRTRTKDGRGSRTHEVILSRGDGPAWCCKHILRALKSNALMPNHRYKEVFFGEEEALAFAGRHKDALVTTCNNCFVVGWARKSD